MIRAEVIKLVTLPSLLITVTLTWAVTLLLGLADPVYGTLVYGQVGFLVLGALAAGHEYQGGGQIRTTLLAMPRRWSLAAAKTVACAVAVTPAALLVAVTAGEPGETGFLVLDTLLAAGVGTIVRFPAGAVAVLLTAYLIVFPLIEGHLPGGSRWLPTEHAAATIWTGGILLVAAGFLRGRGA